MDGAYDSSELLFINSSFIVFPFEESFNNSQKAMWMAEHKHEAFYYAGAYAVLILLGKVYMKNRPRYELSRILTVWNIFLAAFSIIGLCRTLPELLYGLRNVSFAYTVLDNSYVSANKVTGFWSWSFALSKVLELCDTLFIILRKQKLIVLHWFHHATVLIYVWYCYSELAGPGRWFMVMNYFVHSLMYTYYVLRSMHVRMPKYISISITAAQILQMVMGCFVCCYGYLTLPEKSEFSQFPKYLAMYGILMYGTYLLLFSNFFYHAYLSGTKQRKKSD